MLDATQLQARPSPLVWEAPENAVQGVVTVDRTDITVDSETHTVDET